VIPAKHNNVIRITKKEGKEKGNHFDRKLTPVNIIAEKKKTVTRGRTGNHQNANQIKDVAVKVAGDVKWGGKLK
jgi:hypothetical protein